MVNSELEIRSQFSLSANSVNDFFLQNYNNVCDVTVYFRFLITRLQQTAGKSTFCIITHARRSRRRNTVIKFKLEILCEVFHKWKVHLR